MAFYNSIRLPVFFTKPQWPSSQNIFTLADGSIKVLSAQVRKTYEAKTDYLPAAWHEKLRIALLHDEVLVEADKLVAKVAMEGEGYDVNWNDFLDHPTAPAAFTVQVGDYNFTNSNCQTCQEALQLELNDDNLGLHDEGDVINANVFGNDTIFCSPAVASITAVNDLYVDDATIDDAGNITITLKNPAGNATGVLLVTYRVTCPNGGYDEANVYADVNGSVPACSVPQNVRALGSPPTQTAYAITWDETGSPTDGYYWELYEAANMGVPVLTATPPLGFPQADFTGLTPCTDYVFFVKARCETGVSESAFSAPFNFKTECPTVGCGLYELLLDDGTPDTTTYRNVYYLDCNSTQQNVRVYNLTPRFICTIESAPGTPQQIVGPVTKTYSGPC